MNSEYMLKLFSQNVARLRQEAGLTQAALAQRCGKFQKQIPQIEDGTAHVTLAMIVALAQALDVEPGHLLREMPSAHLLEG